MSELTYHYDDTIKIEFDPGEHVYTVSHAQGDAWGEPRIVNGVTTPINNHSPKPWLAAWACKVGAEAATAALYNIPASFDDGDLSGEAVRAYWKLYESDWDSIIKAFKSAHRTRLRSAGDIGTQVHFWCEQWAKSQIPGSGVSRLALPTEPEVLRACETFLEWIERNHVQIVAAEQRVYHIDYDYCGTTDLIAWVNDRFSFLDLKTSGQISLGYHVQNAAYEAAYVREFPNSPPDRNRIVLRLPKDGEPFETAESTDPEDFEAFKRLLELNRYWNIRETAAKAAKKRKK